MGSAIGRGGEGYFAGKGGGTFRAGRGGGRFSFGSSPAPSVGSYRPDSILVATFSIPAQFAVAMVLGAGGGALTAIAAAVLLNARFRP